MPVAMASAMVDSNPALVNSRKSVRVSIKKEDR